MKIMAAHRFILGSRLRLLRPPVTPALLYKAATRLVPHIPPSIAYPLCSIVGGASGPLLPAWRAMLDNLAVVAPDWTPAERERAARRAIGDITKNYYDLFRNPSLPPWVLARELVLDGAEHVQCAVDAGHGVILVAPHTGTYSTVVPLALQRFEADGLLIVEQLEDPAVHEIVSRLRGVPRLEIVPLGPAAGRAALRALRAGHIVVLGGDRAIADNSESVRFFGRPTPIPSGPATLAIRTGAPVVPAEIWRRSDNRSWVRFGAPIRWTPSGDRQRDVRDVTQKIAYHMQEFIGRAPSQWMVAERIWPEETIREERRRNAQE